MAARIEAQVAPEIENDEDLQAVYNWVDEVPLSRPKRNIARDFADGVLLAEVVNNYFPRIVEMHNYSAANSHTQKMYNWNTLNQKVLKKLDYQIHKQDLEDIIKAAPGAVERVLDVLHRKILHAQQHGLRGGRQSVGGRPTATPEGRAGGSEDGGDARGFAGPGDARRGQDPHQAGAGAAAAPPAPGGPVAQRYQREVDTELLVEKEQTIAELREMVVIMSEKIKKLEQLVRIKDSKIEAMTQKMQKYNLA